MSTHDYYQFVYEKLLAIYPEKPWTKIISKMSGKTGKGLTINKFGERMIALGLYLWDTKSFDKCDSYEKGAIAEAFFYSGKFIEYRDSLSELEQGALKSRFGSALKESDDMRAFMFEVFCYHYLLNKGYEVESKDLDYSNETFDYLVKNESEIQVECKSFAYDKGLFINSDEAQNLHNLILERGMKLDQPLNNAVTFVTLEVFRGFPKSKTGQKHLLDEIFKLLSDQSLSNEQFKLDVRTFTDIKNIEQEEIWKDIQFESNGVELAFSICTANGSSSRRALSIRTTVKPALLREFENICKDASKRQFLDNKAGTLFIHIPHVDTYKELKSSSRFEGKVKNIFSRPHLCNIVLFSNLGVYEESSFPYFYLSPLIQEYQNEHSEFKGVSI